MGGGRHPALWVDCDFLRGSSGPCDTYGTQRALTGAPHAADFVVRRFEPLTFT